jgi:hypothetical protein
MGEEDAARRFDLAALHRRGVNAKINFQVSDYMNAAGELVDEPPRDGATTFGGEPLTSKFNGVCWYLKGMKWQAHIRIGSKLVYLGRYMEDEAAARVRDLANLRRGRSVQLNFPLCDYTTAAGEVVYPPHLNRCMVKVDKALAGY